MLIEPLTQKQDLTARLGCVGSITAYDCWDARKSPEHAKDFVATVASISYGNEAAKNPENLFKNIVDRGHFSCLEFVPFAPTYPQHLPSSSLRHHLNRLDQEAWWGNGSCPEAIEEERRQHPCHAFFVEMPLYTRSQWHRHRAFSYLELSRRNTKGSKVGWTYYGDNDPDRDLFWEVVEKEYLRRLAKGEPNEIARGCMPVEAKTKFWCAGFDNDWLKTSFVPLRADAHAQEEIRVFGTWIQEFLGNLKQ
jgi:hypothetical protein